MIERRRRRALARVFVLSLIVVFAAAGGREAVGSPSASSISFGYDDAGRLATVIDTAQTNGVATYGWDAVGNLTAVARKPSVALSVVSFAPTRGAVGTTVQIYGSGFDASTVTNNVVKFNGATATVA